MVQCRSLTDAVQRAAASDAADRVYIEEVTGRTLTYAQTDDLGRRWARLLTDEGVCAGANVAVMAPISADIVLSWLGINWLEALFVGVNTALIGEMLSYVIEQSDAEVAVVHSVYLNHFAALAGSLGKLRTILVLGDTSALPSIPGIELRDADGLLAAAAPKHGMVAGDESQIYGIIYTSGTTGRSKGVLVTWKLLHRIGLDGQPGDLFGPNDVWYSPFPINHVSGAGQVYQAALVGGKVVLRESWKTQEFWPDVRRYGATVTMLIGAMASFLTKQSPSPQDRGHTLRYVQMTPLPDDVAGFEQRFGFQLWTIFAMTECGTVTFSELSPTAKRTCGKARQGYQIRLVGEDGEDVADGQPGELWVRCDDPLSLMQGYYKLPEETAKAWQGEWLRTGDMLMRDAHGNYSFVDRRKDVLRRRGENISSSDVERAVNGHPGVLDSAAIAVPSEHAEDEIMVVIQLQPDAQLDPRELIDFLAARAPRHMIPRYVEIVGELPRTATGKLRKELLRERGRTEATWSAEANAVRS